MMSMQYQSMTKKYDVSFIDDYKYILQDVIDQSGKANWIRIFGVKK